MIPTDTNSVRLSVSAVCKTCIYGGFPFCFPFHCCLVRDLSHLVCLCCAQQEEGSLSGGSRLHKQQQEARTRRVAARDPIKIFGKHCSTPRQKKKKYMNTDGITSQGVVFRRCCAVCHNRDVYSHARYYNSSS